MSQVSTPKPIAVVVVERDPAEAVGGGVADVVEVRRAAADDHAEGDHGVVPLARPARRHDRQLEGARHAHQHRRLDAVGLAGALGAGDAGRP